jgi:ribosome-associated protein
VQQLKQYQSWQKPDLVLGHLPAVLLAIMGDDQDHISDEVFKSKSQRKREMHALQELGEELVKLSKEQFEKITLPDDLHDAIVEARHIHQRGAHKRQLQYIGRLMRSLDPAPIREQLDTILGHSRQAVENLHQIERWRDRLLAEGDHTLEELVTQYPETDRQYLRQLIRNANKETLDNKPPKSTRALFRYLRDLINPE